VENDTWEREEDLRNAKELVDNIEGRLEAEIRCQERVVKKKKTNIGEWDCQESIQQNCCVGRMTENLRMNT